MKRWFDLVGAGFFGAMIFCMMFATILTPLIRLEFLYLGAAVFFSRGITMAPLSLLYVGLACSYVGIALNSPVLPGVVKADFYNIVFGGGLGLILSMDRMKPFELDRFILHLNRFVAGAAVVGAVLGLIKFVALLGGVEVGFASVSEGELYPPGSSLHNDYNVYALGVCYGVVAYIWLSKNEPRIFVKAALDICLPILLAAVLLSGSRRGAIFLGLLAIVNFKRIINGLRGSGARGREVMNRAVWILVFTVFLYVQRGSIASFWDSFLGSTESRDIQLRMETMGSSDLFSTRFDYWDGARTLLANFSFTDYLFGTGFDYVWFFGQVSGNEEDYPHNLFLSALLYGGALQLVLTMAMVWTALKRTYAGGNLTMSLFYWLLMEVAFLFFSSNSFFSSLPGSVLTVLGLTVKLPAKGPEPGP